MCIASYSLFTELCSMWFSGRIWLNRHWHGVSYLLRSHLWSRNRIPRKHYTIQIFPLLEERLKGRSLDGRLVYSDQSTDDFEGNQLPPIPSLLIPVFLAFIHIHALFHIFQSGNIQFNLYCLVTVVGIFALHLNRILSILFAIHTINDTMSFHIVQVEGCTRSPEYPRNLLIPYSPVLAVGECSNYTVFYLILEYVIQYLCWMKVCPGTTVWIA